MLGCSIPTNLAIDDRLIAEAQKLGHHRTKKETVTAALDEYIKRRKQQSVLSLFGTIEYDEACDYRRERSSKRTWIRSLMPPCGLALRRKIQDLNAAEKASVAELTELIEEGRARIIGLIRQELLSGIKNSAQYEKLRADRHVGLRSRCKNE
jgi:Arc/MetJ family transcription regulator